jgi:hypothetical protein
MLMGPLHQKTVLPLLYTPREPFLLSSLFRSALRRHLFPALLLGNRAPSCFVPNNRPPFRYYPFPKFAQTIRLFSPLYHYLFFFVYNFLNF